MEKSNKSGAAGGIGKANMAGAMDNTVAGGSHAGASAELKAQHPLEHYDHGPHHGTDHHRRHIPVKI